MPKVNDIVNVAEALEKSPVAVARDRCLAVRNRNASCRRCVRACPVDAIEISANELHLDASACANCGACVAVCPTEALSALQPSDAALAAALADAASNDRGRAVIACARISSKRIADPARYAEVPCLARIDESLVVGLAARGVHEVLLVDGTCATCKYGKCSPGVDDMLADAAGLATGQGSTAVMARASQFPEDMLVEDSNGLFGSTRRGFFAEAAGAARETALTAARATVAQELGIAETETAIGERLRVTSDGSLPRLRMPRHESLINSMDAIGPAMASEIVSRRFAAIEIDVAKCNACGMCVVFCPTGALKRVDGGDISSDARTLEFSAADCIACDLCADVCWKGALVVSSTVSTSQLFDFEPVTIDLSQAQRSKAKLFGK